MTYPDEVADTLTLILEDYNNGHGLFSDVSEDAVELPLKEALTELDVEGAFHDDRDRALYVTFTLAVNFAKPANRLSRRLQALWNDEHWIFDPPGLVGDHRYDDILDLFKGQGRFQNHRVMDEYGLMEHGKRDTDIWYTVAYTLYHEFDSNPLVLLDEHDNDALAVYEYVSEARRDTPRPREDTDNKEVPVLGWGEDWPAVAASVRRLRSAA